jgi:hypothetical protein
VHALLIEQSDAPLLNEVHLPYLFAVVEEDFVGLDNSAVERNYEFVLEACFGVLEETIEFVAEVTE